MARAVLRVIVFGLATTGLLMGCVDGGGNAASGDGTGMSGPSARKKSGAQDVEAPEVFAATDSALWDGRPSLGGIWVASPEVTNPERAIMFNPATGKSVTGALFKRERDNPGPPLQLSSDAAEALGILAGQPTEIKVTALRKEEAAAEVPAEVAADTASDATAPADEPATGGDAAAIATAALDAVGEAKTEPATPDDDADPAAAALAGTAAVAATATEGGAAVLDAAPEKKTWKERRAEAKAARQAKKQAAAEAKAAAAAAAAGTAVAAEGEAPTATPDAAAAAIAPIESAPLDARKPDVASAADTATEKPVAKPKTKAAAEAAPVAEPAPPAPAPVAGGAARPIQVASFSKEDNAKRAAEALAKIGIIATPQKSDKAGKAVWGVVVMGDDALLQKIKDAGFADAYYLK